MTRRWRILAVLESLGAGGAERALLDQFRELSRRGHECHVAYLWGPADLASAFEGAAIRVHPLDVGRRTNIPGAARPLVALSRRLRPDVVQAQLYLAGLAAGLSHPLDPRPARIAVFHNLAYESFPVDSPWRRGRRVAERVAMKRGMDALVAVTEAVAGHYSEHLRLPRGFVTVIPNGVDTDALRAEADAQLEVATGPGLVVLPATFRHEKGHRFLLEATALLRDRGVAVHVALAGDGPLRAEVDRKVEELQLRGSVEFRGLLEHGPLMSLLAAADVVALPSTHEGLPVSALEAMALGRAVVASAVGGLPELISDGADGLLIPPGDPEALADALERLLRNPDEASRLGTAGAATVAERYAVAPVADAWESLYAELSCG